MRKYCKSWTTFNEIWYGGSLKPEEGHKLFIQVLRKESRGQPLVHKVFEFDKNKQKTELRYIKNFSLLCFE